ncbi:MAG TPA: alpha/beta fold hydrolase [Oculatellaceae cyanobacterium]
MSRKLSFLSLSLALVAAFSTQVGLAAPSGDLSCDIGKELNLPVTEWLDKTQETKGIVIAVHGLTLYAGAFEPIATKLASRGFHVYALDMRGFGRWMSEGKNFGGDNRIHIGQSQSDLISLVERVRKDNPTKKVFFLGESQGANLALWVIENHPELTDGAIIASPCFRTRVHPSPRWLIDGVKELVMFDKPLNLTPYTRPYLTNDPVLTEKCDNDPLVNRKMTPDELVKCLIENKHAIKEAGTIPADYPILMLAGTKDGVFKSTGLPKEIKKFGDYKEISLTMLEGKGHLLIEHQPVDAKIGALVDSWLDKQMSLPRIGRPALNMEASTTPPADKKKKSSSDEVRQTAEATH